jgi:hypothetical protein
MIQRWMKALLARVHAPMAAQNEAIFGRTEAAIAAAHRNARLAADLLIARIRSEPAMTLRQAEFSVFSQWGEDGILQWLLARVPVESETFVEFGVENYTEANTRFLLTHQNWTGLVIDGSAAHIDAIKRQDIHWQHDLTAVHAFITRENINELIARRFRGDIGVLSIDVDGNDYWIWEAIGVVSPRIVVCEYNSVFGCERAITVPYDPKFFRTAAHYSNLYFGASLPALCRLAARKGYVFAGCTRAGNDAFFVRQDVAGKVKALMVEEGYVRSKMRESRDASGALSFLSGDERFAAIAHLEVFDVDAQKLVRLDGVA